HLPPHSFPTRRSSDLHVEHHAVAASARFEVALQTLGENAVGELAVGRRAVGLADLDAQRQTETVHVADCFRMAALEVPQAGEEIDRKSTRLNSSHRTI